MTRYCYIFILQLIFVFAVQANESRLFPDPTKASADSLLIALRGSKADTNKVMLLLKLANYYVYKPGEHKADMDSSGTCLATALSLSNSLHFKKGQIISLLLWGVVFSESQGIGRAQRITRKAVALSEASTETLITAKAWFYLAEVYPNSNEATLNYKISCYQRAMTLFNQAGDKEAGTDMLGRIANIHYVQGHYPQALREFLGVLAQFKALNAPLFYTYNLLAVVSTGMGNYHESIKYGHAAIEDAKVRNDTTDLGYFYLVLARAYYDLNQWDAGRQYLEMALHHFENRHETMMVLSTGNGICKGMIKVGKAKDALTFYTKLVKKNPPGNSLLSKVAVMQSYGDCYLALKKFDLAEKNYLGMIALEEQLKRDNVELAGSYKQIGNYYLIVRDYAKAKYYLQKALKFNGRYVNVRLASQLHSLLFKVDSAQGNYLNAIAHHQQFKLLSDSIFNIAKASKIASLNIQYDIKEKEKNIALLNRQSIIQKATIREKEIQRNATIGGAIMLFLFSILIYNQYRIKKRSNEQLTVQQSEISHKNSALLKLIEEKEWLLKEVHHRVKNNLQTVISLLELQTAYPEQNSLTVIRNSQRRVFAMSLVHQKLYQSDDVRIVKMNLYLKELVDYLKESLGARKTIRFRLNLDPVELEVATAVPLALILNEAITNALKYAFPSSDEGEISISMGITVAEQIYLTIADNGVGLPAHFNIQNHNSLGMKLIAGLSNDIDADLKIENDNGTKISLIFRPEEDDDQPRETLEEQIQKS